MITKHPKFFIIEIFMLVCIKLILEYVYQAYISVIFAYNGYKFFFDPNAYLIGWFFYFLGYFCIKIKSNNNLYYFYILMLFLWYLPNIIFYAFNKEPVEFLMLLNVPFLIIILLTFNFKKVPFNIKYGKFYVLASSFILLTITLFHFILVTGGHLNFNFSEVYNQREMYGEASASGLFGYLNSWSFKIFNVVLFWPFQPKENF